MAVRSIPTAGPKSGATMATAINAEITALWDRTPVPLSSIGGSATVITATCDVTLPASGYADGMQFLFIPASNSTGATTLNIDSKGAKALVDSEGNALAADTIVAGVLYHLLYISASNHIRVLGTYNVLKILDDQTFTSSATWNKPSGPADSQVIVQIWGGGGGGSNAANGGAGAGGSYVELRMKLSDLGSTETVTIGAGGGVATTGAAGGNTTFGAHGTAYGGGGGASGGGGGGGGGQTGAGSVGSGVDGGAGGGITNGAGAVGSTSVAGDGGAGGGGGGSTNAAEADGGDSVFGGGGGGGSIGGGDGGGSIWGGGGGGGTGGGLGGTSLHGGAGGNNGAAGSAPSGGGGRNGAGARGEVRVWVIG